VFNIHEANRLFAVSARTLQTVFATVDLYRSGFGGSLWWLPMRRARRSRWVAG
jgi:hypothetical protein